LRRCVERRRAINHLKNIEKSKQAAGGRQQPLAMLTEARIAETAGFGLFNGNLVFPRRFYR
jgi:hypothetical protein